MRKDLLDILGVKFRKFLRSEEYVWEDALEF